ncbi:phage tail tape measure protein [Spartinivicinus ruber]|uniref:phage tail tape measure protein n=1 Tax=Spartinivicinus ruber TaxID=2683272 RepID=UPI0013D831FD|nr:phage tail tape measure protein [Spartinivicinus ruber]
MANAATGRLNFIISLTDRLTSPIAGLQNRLDQLSSGATQAFANVGVGIAGLMGVGYTLKAALEPAIDMDRALGEVKSLGVIDSDLAQLKNTALDFSVEYGKSASEFVRASYDIQSAISGLTGEELGQFTKASGVLAAATKSDTATITSYMGTMYGIFSEQAEVMGNANWVNTVAGQTASAVQMFKTTGGEMAGAFTALGANATAAGIAMHEQMAILGRLQATMSGSEAGTKYKAFLSGVGIAQDKLGLKFTDSQDRLLPMADILDKLKGKFGDTLEVAESDALKKAFGSDEAVSLIKLLMKDIDGLNSNINQLGEIKGLDKAEMMARAQVDAWERFGAAVDAVLIGFGSTLLPVINPVIDRLADMGQTLQRWTQLFPNVTRWVGYFFLGIMGLIAGMATLTLISGLVYGSLMGLKLLIPILTGLFTLLKWAFYAVSFAGKVLQFTLVILPGLFGILGVVVSGALSAMGAALTFLLSPIGLIIAAVALISFGVYKMIQHWDTCKQVLIAVGKAILDVPLGWFNSAVSWTTDAIEWLVNGWQWLLDVLANTVVFQILRQVLSFLSPAIGLLSQGFNWLGALWQRFTTHLAEVGVFQVIMEVLGFLSPGIGLLIKGFQQLGEWWDKLKKTFADIGVFEFLGSIVDWVIDKINMIPGIHIEIDKAELTPQMPKLKQPLQSQVPVGGLSSTINNNQQQHNQNNYQTNHIYTQSVDSQFLANEWIMAAP